MSVPTDHRRGRRRLRRLTLQRSTLLVSAVLAACADRSPADTDASNAPITPSTNPAPGPPPTTQVPAGSTSPTDRATPPVRPFTILVEAALQSIVDDSSGSGPASWEMRVDVDRSNRYVFLGVRSTSESSRPTCQEVVIDGDRQAIRRFPGSGDGVFAEEVDPEAFDFIVQRIPTRVDALAGMTGLVPVAGDDGSSLAGPLDADAIDALSATLLGSAPDSGEPFDVSRGSIEMFGDPDGNIRDGSISYERGGGDADDQLRIDVHFQHLGPERHTVETDPADGFCWREWENASSIPAQSWLIAAIQSGDVDISADDRTPTVSIFDDGSVIVTTACSELTGRTIVDESGTPRFELMIAESTCVGESADRERAIMTALNDGVGIDFHGGVWTIGVEGEAVVALFPAG